MDRQTDDGVRLWVDGQLIIDDWEDQSPTLNSGQIQLNDFGPYDIEMEYYENGGGAVARLYWESSSTPYGIIPDNFMSPNLEALTAYGPYPLDGSWVLNWEPVLSWGPALFATTHDLYISTDFDDVNERAVTKISLSDPCYTSPRLDLDQTYYWAVDGIHPTNPDSPWEGDVWSFYIPPGGTGSIIREWWRNMGGNNMPDLYNDPRYPDYPTGRELIPDFEGPVNIWNNYGTRIHGWLRPPTTGDYRFWIATDNDGELYLSPNEDPADANRISMVRGAAPSRGWDDGDVTPSGPIFLEAGKKYYIAGLQKEETGDDNIAVAWQGPANSPVSIRVLISGEYLSPTPHDPPEAYGPYPRDGATNVEDRSPVLSWKPGLHAQAINGHRLYISPRFADVNERRPAADRGFLTEPNYPYPPPPLLLDHTYYWVVDEVSSTVPPYLWEGKVWSFTTAPCMALDNMEDYNDRGEIKGVWTDGYSSVGWGGSYPFKHP
ncbi:MAG: PA14 domain-containing protein, partial [Planctomycetota bacterium]